MMQVKENIPWIQSKKRNSITYDAEKDELKIITYYDERRYKEIWVRD